AVTAPVRLPARGRAARGWASFVGAAVARYGPRGSFWAENPSLPRRPVHTWQVWNEQNFKYFVVRPNPAEYARLLRRSARAIRGADRRARIVLGGLFARPAEARLRLRPPRAYFAAEFLAEMYRRSPGIGSKFDGIALHPYSGSYRQLPAMIEEARKVLRRHRDAGKGLWITELGWSSQRPSRRNSFAKGRRGQAAQLKGAFKLLRRNQGRWRLRQVFWFSVDDQAGSCNFCGGSGLFGRGFRPKPAWRAYVRFAGGQVR
ncbi:MAG: glycosyl hydrolase, partial [Solirubrobacterales bacterium]